MKQRGGRGGAKAPRMAPARRRAAPVGSSSAFAALATERVHPAADRLDALPIAGVVRLLLDEEAKAVAAVARAAAAITAAAELYARTLASGGRVIYVGAGTSGRLGALDAAELPPTFGIAAGRVIALVAGGPAALQRSVEGAEDRRRGAAAAMARLDVGAGDLVCAIAASGVTPYTLGALDLARARGARTIFITARGATGATPAPSAAADLEIAVDVGPEVIAGSTRLKAGTATKLVLNGISTAAMVRLGKVYRGRMIDLVATNAKLRARALRIVGELGAVDEAEADRLLTEAGGEVRVALAAAITRTTVAAARKRLAKVGGKLADLATRGSTTTAC